MTQPNNPIPIAITPDPGIQTANFTTNGEHKLLVSGDVGVGLSKYQATSHNLYTTSGIMNISKIYVSDRPYMGYSTHVRDEALPSYHAGNIEIPTVNVNMYSQYKIKDLSKNEELLVQGGVNVRTSLTTSHELAAANPLGDKEIPYTAWGSRVTQTDGSQRYTAYNATENFTYNSGYLSPAENQPVVTPKHTVKEYLTLNYAKANENGVSFNVGAGVEGQGAKFNPLLTSVVAKELNNGAKIAGGLNYSFTGGRKVDHHALDQGFQQNAAKKFTLFNTSIGWDYNDATIDPAKKAGTEVVNNGKMLAVYNPADDELPKDVSGAFNKASLGRLGAQLSYNSAQMPLGKKGNTWEFFVRGDVNVGDALTKVKQSTAMSSSIQGFYQLSDSESIQKNYETMTLTPVVGAVSGGVKINIGSQNPTRCPVLR